MLEGSWVSQNAQLSLISQSAGGAAGALGSGRAPKPRPSPKDPRKFTRQTSFCCPLLSRTTTNSVQSCFYLPYPFSFPTAIACKVAVQLQILMRFCWFDRQKTCRGAPPFHASKNDIKTPPKGRLVRERCFVNTAGVVCAPG